MLIPFIENKGAKQSLYLGKDQCMEIEANLNKVSEIEGAGPQTKESLDL
tara:strand:- start:449 stop:595 length:147 start_codon:yes stop_codon:yes gene_type:complete